MTTQPRLDGSNMQRQAVPLLQSEAPLVGTGLEGVVDAIRAAIAARRNGVVDQVTRRVSSFARRKRPTLPKPGVDIYRAAEVPGVRINRPAITQRPLVKVGDRVKAGDIVATVRDVGHPDDSPGRC